MTALDVRTPAATPHRRATRLPRLLHPGAWWLWAAGLAVAASRTTNPLLLLLIVAVAGYVVAARRSPSPWARSFSVFLKLGLVVIAIRVVFQAIVAARAEGYRHILAGYGDCGTGGLLDRVLEARGLDVTPGMIARLRSNGDPASAAILEVILAEEVAHVAAGTRWYHWHCERAGLSPGREFIRLVRETVRGGMRGPFNRPARLAAGFEEDEIRSLETME